MSEPKPQFDLFAGATPTPEAPPPTTEEARDSHPPLASLIGKLAHAIDERLSTGDVADLRRLDPKDPSCPAFWKVATHHLDGELPAGGEARDEAERRWAAILSGMAHSQNFHRPGRRLGQALAEAGFSELRLARLLREKTPALLEAAVRAARFLAARGEGFDWSDMARLILSEGRADEEKIRRQIARDYFARMEKP